MQTSFKLPDLGEGIHEGEVLAVLVSVGDNVKEEEPLLEVETDKAAVEIPSPFTGKVIDIRIQPGDVVKVGQVLITFETETTADQATSMPEAAASPPAHSAPASPKQTQRPVPASPSTRQKARELGVDLRQVPPTGPEGLVTAEDVKAFAARSKAAPPPTCRENKSGQAPT